jgi:hypothetical protein
MLGVTLPPLPPAPVLPDPVLVPLGGGPSFRPSAEPICASHDIDAKSRGNAAHATP